jgi:hypothetical protein
LTFSPASLEVGFRLVAPALSFGSPVAQGGQSVSQACRPRGPGGLHRPHGIQAIACCNCTASLALIGPPVHTGQRRRAAAAADLHGCQCGSPRAESGTINQFFDGSVSEPIPHSLGPMRDRGPVGYWSRGRPECWIIEARLVLHFGDGSALGYREQHPSSDAFALNYGLVAEGVLGVGNPPYRLSLEMYWPFWASDTDQSLQPTVNLV